MCYLPLGLHVQNVPEKADLAHHHRTSGVISLESGCCKTAKGQPDWCRHKAEFSEKPSKISSSMDGLPTHQMSISEKGAGVARWQVETWNSGTGRKGASHRHCVRRTDSALLLCSGTEPESESRGSNDSLPQGFKNTCHIIPHHPDRMEE